MQPLAAGTKLAAYHARLRGSHDFRVYVDVLTLNETLVGSASFLDGQVNIASDGLVRRTCSLTLSDPDGALDFADASRWSDDSIWVDRLIRVRHVVDVPGYGAVTAVPFIGPPTSLARQGIEVQVQCSDKGALAARGAHPYTAAKGTIATSAIKAILSKCTGEFRFRMPAYTRRLSKPYAVGLTDEASPLAVASQIASGELNMQLIYSCDGFVTLRPKPTSAIVDIGPVTEPASGTIDFTTVANFVRVTGGATSKKKGGRTVSTTPVSTAEVASSSSVSSTRLSRQGVKRLLPLLIEETSYTKGSQTEARAKREIASASRLMGEVGAQVVPMFHLDVDDIVRLQDETGADRAMALSTGSIPLGVGGDMQIGFQRQVSKVSVRKPRTVSVRKVAQKKRKPGSKPRRRRRGRE